MMPGKAPGPVAAGTASDLCGVAVAAASAGSNLPAGLLDAIAVVESGRINARTGIARPWPWTIDANGTGYMYASEQAAIQAAAAFQAAGITSLDIGCLQVNLLQHPNAFQSLAAGFDPAENASYAARFLSTLYAKFGNWPAAVAAYHSQTPAYGGPYQAKVYADWQGAGAMPAFAATGTVAAPVSAVASAGSRSYQPALAMTAYNPPMEMMLRPRGGSLGSGSAGSGFAGSGFVGRGLAAYRASPVAIAASQVPQG